VRSTVLIGAKVPLMVARTAGQKFVAEDGTVFSVVITRSSAGPPLPFEDFLPPFGWSDYRGWRRPVKAFLVNVDERNSLLRFESDFGLAIAEHLLGRVAIHAAVISIGPTTLLLPGRSGSGKSSLAAEALRQGHSVLSDEYCVVSEESLDIVPWPRPIRLIQLDGTVERQKIPYSSRSGVTTPTHVVKLAFVPSQPEPLWVEAMSHGQTAFALLENTVCGQSRPRSSLAVASELARRASGFAGLRGDALDALPELLSLTRKAKNSL
jgi:hypothetical protein